MCGLTGFWDFKKTRSDEELSKIVGKMSEKISHRGPDSSGTWCDQKVGLAIGHRRLSIVDLTDAGHQPMVSNSGRYVIAYNGEIYNTIELRKELKLEGTSFRGHSDTEVLLSACEAWGVLEACHKVNGMFAFVLWDSQEKTLSFVRDRLGKKPLYWGFNNGILFFGSQLKSFMDHPSWQGTIDRDALVAYFRYNYIPAPYSIFKNIKKLKPGCIVTISQTGSVNENYYWEFQKVVERGAESRKKLIASDDELIEELNTLLSDAVKRRMIADVPLGALLSGGIDSSTIVALMQAQSIRPIKTFSIGFHEEEYNEAVYARAVANHLNTDHHELYLESSEARDIIPSISDWCDEPFADVSQIPTFLVSRLAREKVIVSLSGDGGDELFAGYNRYIHGGYLWGTINQLPSWIRKSGVMGIRSLSPRAWDTIAKIFQCKSRSGLFGEKLYKLSDALNSTNRSQFYHSLVSHWKDPGSLVLTGKEIENNYSNEFADQALDFVEFMQLMDTITYLPDDILTKVDRASMAVGLEARVPMLDQHVVEFAWRLPMNLKIRNGQSKWLLRQVLNRYVPKELIERPKMGFGVPMNDWLRGPLRDWAENLLSDNRLQEEGILNPTPIRIKWLEHLSGRKNWQNELWGVLMFQAWQERWKQ